MGGILSYLQVALGGGDSVLVNKKEWGGGILSGGDFVRIPSFIFPQRSFGMANPVKRSFQASWFSTRTWLYHNETYKISSASRVKIVPKCIKIV